MTVKKDIAYVKSLIKAYPDFPQKGILFQDIFPIFQDYEAVDALVETLLGLIPRHGAIDAVVGLDARGFLLGPRLASELKCSFVPVRKRGKLPGQCEQVSYIKEYGTDYFEMQAGALKPGARVVVFDDLLATGGSAYAAQQLIEKCEARVVVNLFIMELTGLQGAKKLNAPVKSVFKYED